MDAKLRKLLELVEDRSDRGRNLLFRHVCDLFFHGPLPESPADRAALVDILRILRPRTDLTLRRELAGHLYSMERPPEALLRLALEDEPAVADAILDFAPLPESLLRELAGAGKPHVIARLLARPDLGPHFRDLIAEAQSPDLLAPTAQPAPLPAPDLLPDLGGVRSALDQAYSRQDQLADFSQAGNDWLWETDRSGRIVYLSDQAGPSLGVTSAILLGQRLPDLFTDAAALEDKLSSWRPFDGLRLQQPASASAEQRRWLLGGVPAFDLGSGRFTGYRGTAVLHAPPRTASLTAARREPAADTAPAATGTNATAADGLEQDVTEALQTLSHEIRTPLNAIIGFSELIELGAAGQVNDAYKDCLRQIQAAGHHLNEFVTEILEDTRLRRDNVTPGLRAVVIAQLIRSAVEAVERHATVRRIAITVTPPRHETIIVTDPQFAERCLVRLLRCAIADAPDGSVIAIEAHNLPDGGIDIRIPIPDAGNAPMTTPGGAAGAPLKALRLQQIRALADRIGAVAEARPRSLSLRLPAAEQGRDDSARRGAGRGLPRSLDQLMSQLAASHDRPALDR